MNRTPNLELVLYEANDIMDGVEFINDNNSKIDTYASQTRAIAQSANALAGQANEGVGAADTKIEAINTRLQQDEVDTLPQYKSDTDGRLEALEDDVNSFIKPINRFTRLDGSFLECYESGGMLYINALPINSAIVLGTNSLETSIIGNEEIISLPKKGDFAKAAGNVYGMEVNKLKVVTNFQLTQSNKQAYVLNVGVYYNGVDTILTLATSLESLENGYFYAYLPVGMLTTTA